MLAEQDDPKRATPRAGVDEKTLIEEMRDRYALACDYWNPQFRKAVEDMKFAFLPDHQWDDWMIASRKDRPMYTVNKLRQALKQITNDQRMNRPQPKVRAVEDGDTELAELRQGLFRNIEQQSTADRAYDTAFQFAVGGGYGVWRIETKYAAEGSFDQDIRIKEVANPFAVRVDPAAREKDRRDARFAFVDDELTHQQFRAKYPGKEIRDFDSSMQTSELAWWSEQRVRIAEYWYKEPEDSIICLMSDGRVVEKESIALIADELAAQGVTVVRERSVVKDRVKHCIVSGAEILEGPNDWPGHYIPIVIVWGCLLNIEGKEVFCGETAFSKDAQRMYNYERSTFIEVLADQPYSPLMADAASIEGYEEQYQSLRTKKPPVLLYNGDANKPNGGKPSRESPPMFPAALAQAAQISADDIKSGTGKFDASLGARSNETSGRAILARQKEGDVSSFDYMDNLSYAQKYSYEIINDLIPPILNTERQIRVVGDDGAETVVSVNKPVFDEQTGQWITVNDLAQGRFDIAVTIGPSFSTQRMEMAEAMMQLSNDPSPIGLIAKYGFLKSLDAPGMDELLKGARKVLVGQGLLEPEEEDQPPAPPPPNPKDVADAKKNDAMAKKYDAEAEQTTAETQRMIAMDQFALAQSPIPTDVPGMPAIPPPMPMQPQQPAQAGFFMPDDMGYPPQ